MPPWCAPCARSAKQSLTVKLPSQETRLFRYKKNGNAKIGGLCSSCRRNRAGEFLARPRFASRHKRANQLSTKLLSRSALDKQCYSANRLFSGTIERTVGGSLVRAETFLLHRPVFVGWQPAYAKPAITSERDKRRTPVLEVIVGHRTFARFFHSSAPDASASRGASLQDFPPRRRLARGL